MTEIAGDLPRITFVGFGEAGHAIASGWARSLAAGVRAYDLKLLDPQAASEVSARAGAAGVQAVSNLEEALDGAEMIFSLVTADKALEAAREAVPYLAPGALWLDCNSCAPQTKQKAALLVEEAGGRYVDVAVMAPVYPKRHEVPLLLAGPHAEQAAGIIAKLDMRPKIAGERVGDASSVKMLRSVIVKGLEALTTECLLAARRAGVEDAVLASLQASDPGIDWRARGSYNLERMIVHGARRAAEVQEVCVTLREFGVPDWMSSGTVKWQQAISDLHLDAGDDDLARRCDAVLDTL